jgi:hypothetical protein
MFNQVVNLTLLIAALAQLSCGLRPDRVTFQAKVADLRRLGNSFARNKRPDDSVAITLPGRMLAVPGVVKLVGRREADWSTGARVRRGHPVTHRKIGWCVTKQARSAIISIETRALTGVLQILGLPAKG